MAIISERWVTINFRNLLGGPIDIEKERLSLHQSYVANADAFLLVYSVNS